MVHDIVWGLQIIIIKIEWTLIGPLQFNTYCFSAQPTLLLEKTFAVLRLEVGSNACTIETTVDSAHLVIKRTLFNKRMLPSYY